MSSNSIFKKGFSVSLAIILCRIMGLFREILLAKTFGGGALMTGWGLAFMVPNLFRRLFGEGVMGTVLVPILSHSLEKESIRDIRKKLGTIFLTLTLLLCSISIVISIIALFIKNYVETERLKIALELIPFLMPYLIFICIVGIFSSALNCVGEFFLPALGTLFFNLLMILSLLFICPLFLRKISMLKSLAVTVVISGIFQLLFTGILMKKCEIFPLFEFSQFWKNPVIKELWKLSAPAMVGASALQISFVADRLMACWIGDYAVPALTFSDRIIDLPIGIFAVALGSVIAPYLAKSAAKNDHIAHQNDFLSTLSVMLFLSISASIFIFFMREPLIRIFYMRGAFGEKELRETSWAMAFYSPGIPFFCCIKVLASVFYSKKDMKTPVKVSIICIVLNIIMNLLFMIKLRQGGIALATVLSSAVNCSVLIYLIKRENNNIYVFGIFIDILRFYFSAFISALLLLYSYNYLLKMIGFKVVVPEIFPLILSGIIFFSFFLLFTKICGSKIQSMILKSILKI